MTVQKMVDLFKCEGAMLWYRYDQNNSGGFYVRDDDVDANVFIQADNVRMADRLAQDVTRDSADNYCECCGERWYIYASDVDEIPSMWGDLLGERDIRGFFGSIFYMFDGSRYRLDKDGKFEKWVEKGYNGVWVNV